MIYQISYNGTTLLWRAINYSFPKLYLAYCTSDIQTIVCSIMTLRGSKLKQEDGYFRMFHR